MRSEDDDRAPWLTLEVRWFRPGPEPDPIADWLREIAPGATAEPVRTDRYLLGAGEGLSVKDRDGTVEIKQRSGPSVSFTAGRAAGAIEAWRKVALPGVDPAAIDALEHVDVVKRRLLGRLAGPAPAVAVELTELEIAGYLAWTVGIEAEAVAGLTAGRLIARLEPALAAANAPHLPADACLGYPAWLARDSGR